MKSHVRIDGDRHGSCRYSQTGIAGSAECLGDLIRARPGKGEHGVLVMAGMRGIEPVGPLCRGRNVRGCIGNADSQRRRPGGSVRGKMRNRVVAVDYYGESDFFGILAAAIRRNTQQPVIRSRTGIRVHRILFGTGRPVAKIPVPGSDKLPVCRGFREIAEPDRVR